MKQFKIFAMTFCLCTVAFTSKTMAQEANQFDFTYNNFRIRYEVMSVNEVFVQGVWIDASTPIVLSIPETVVTGDKTYTVKQYRAALDMGTDGDKVSEFVIPNTIDSIFGRMWSTSVHTFTFGTGLKYIDEEVFRGSKLQTVNCNALTPPTIQEGNKNHAFWDWPENMAWTSTCVVKAPCASLYQNSYWGTVFSNFVQTGTCPGSLIESVSAPSSGISVYPNPVEHILNVVSDREIRNGTLALFDMTGKLITRQESK